MRRPAATSLLACVALLCALTVGSSTASARTQTFSAVSSSSPVVLAFPIRSVVARRVRSGYVRIGGVTRRIAKHRLRVAARRGLLRVWPRRSVLVRAGVAKPRLFLRVVRAARHTPGAAIPANAVWTGPGGSDSAQGTREAPLRTLDAALDRVGDGGTVVLKGGTFGARGKVTAVEGRGVTVIGDGQGARPRILGQFRLDGQSSTASGLLFDGPTGAVSNRTSENPGGEDVQVWIRGNGATVTNSEVRHNKWHAGIYVSDATGVRITNSYIHDNGDFGNAEQANYDHGIYWGSGSGLVQGNRIDHNLAWGVHLYPTATNVQVRNNRITRQGKGGVILAEDASRNLIEHNVVKGNELGIRGYSLHGDGNRVISNSLSANAEGDFYEMAGVAMRGNVTRSR